MIVKRSFHTKAKYEGKEYEKTWVGYFLFGFIPLYIRQYTPGID